MDTYRRITLGFQETIEAITGSVDLLAEPLEQAANRIVASLLNEGKILCCGNGASAAMAQLLVGLLLHRFEHERPALPAMNLCADGATLAGIGTAAGANDIFSRQIRALGQPADVLVCFSNEPSNASIIQAVSAAHEREIQVISLSGAAPVDISSVLLPEDLELAVHAVRPPRITELHTMLVHQLCELIDNALFGSYES